MCCAIKCLVSWNVCDVGSITRERCGGQGYLSVNRLADAMAFAHAGMTAEGDNKVLIQKVTKELITDLGTGKTENPEMTIEQEDLIK